MPPQDIPAEIVRAVFELILLILLFDRLLPQLLFTRTRGLWIARITPILQALFYLILPVTLLLGLLLSNAGHLNILVTGRVIARRLLIATEFLQQIGTGRSPFATSSAMPGDDLAGSVVRIRANAGNLVYRIGARDSVRDAYLAEWPD